jgi:NDP-sugar pyrophosphorylase family protein
VKAMVLAAGLGTRLRPLTDQRPKALVEVAGRTLLDLTLSRLRAFGIHDVIINTHHFSDVVAAYLQTHQNFGMHIEISREDVLLDTGGGIKKAASFFCDSNEPFLVHNVDVLSSIDLHQMLHFHEQHQALVTLAVQSRSTSRYLLFDDHCRLCGRRSGLDGKSELARPVNATQSLAFCGIHILSPRIFSLVQETGAFSVIPLYLRLAAQNETLLAYRADRDYWRDLGRAEHIEAAERDIREGKYSL